MKTLIALLILGLLASCSSLEHDELMDELNATAKSDEARLLQLGGKVENHAGIEFIDPTDRLLLQEDFDCKKTQVAMAYCGTK